MISKKEDIEVGKNFNDDYIISRIWENKNFYDLQLLNTITSEYGAVRIMKSDLTNNK